MKKTLFICDVCQSAIAENKALRKIVIPIHTSDSGGCLKYIEHREFEICTECSEKLLNVLDTYFARIEDRLGYIDINKCDSEV